MADSPEQPAPATGRRIAGLALPALGVLAAEPLYLLFDLAVVGRLGALALAGLADEVIVSTSPKTLGQPGIVAVRPGLAAQLADPDLYGLVETGMIGQDRFEHFTRRG